MTVKKKVLIADDERPIRMLVHASLGEEYAVLEAKNGQEAVQAALSQSPDLILMDMMMPEKDGLTALQELKANKSTKSIPVVMVTGVGHQLNLQLALNLGASGYITKPFTVSEILDTVSKHLKH